jgi:hypothetical protein
MCWEMACRAEKMLAPPATCGRTVLVMSADDDRDLLRVGDIAAAAGLTVRAMHHYEEIGLLVPTARTPAGHRLYGPEAVQRLYLLSRCVICVARCAARPSGHRQMVTRIADSVAGRASGCRRW